MVLICFHFFILWLCIILTTLIQIPASIAIIVVVVVYF
jgi:hypothetical protein